MDYWLHAFTDDPRPAPRIPVEPRAERAAPDDVDRVYRALLAQLTLPPSHRKALVARGLDEASIAAGMYRTLPARGRAEIARAVVDRFPERLTLSVPGFHVRDGESSSYVTLAGPPGLLIPVLDMRGRVVALKVRRDKDDEGPRYVYVSGTAHGGSGPGAPVHVPAWTPEIRRGPVSEKELEEQVGTWHRDGVVRLTEGELKADVATRLSGTFTISVPGVSAWRSALPVLRALSPSRVLLAFDADASTNLHVRRATEATAEALAREGWEAAIETWDGERAKGIDDALRAGVPIEASTRTVPGPGPEPRNDRVSSTNTSAELSPNGILRDETTAYRATRDGLVWRRPTKDGPIDLRLTNFTARIVTDVTEDDGAEVRRRFEIEGGLNGYGRTFTVAAESFASMNWATEHLGARAIVFPGFGIRDHARAAVQIVSGHIPERHVFSHTGWRDIGDAGWAFLHGGGAIGAHGLLPGIEVFLPDLLARLELPAPPGWG
jgi:hypothetical protein